MTRYTLYGGGQGSFRAAKVDRAQHPDADYRLVFTDTLYEDADTYRFLIESAANVFGRRLNWTINADAAPGYRAPAGTLIENYRGNPEWRAWLAELRERVTAAIPELIRLVEGRDPWEVFKDRRYLDNTRQTERECPPDGYRFDGQRRANASAQEGACGIKGSRFVSSPSVLRVIAGSSTSLISKTPTAENSAPI